MPTSLTTCLGALVFVSLQSPIKAELPVATGKFGVGVRTFDWTDETRPETQSDKDGEKRRLLVYLFYPTAKGAPGVQADYFPHLKEIEAFEEQFGKDTFKKSYGSSYAIISRLKCHAIDNAIPVTATEKLPVVIFSHGGGISVRYYTAIIENFVSHGYVVAAVEHCYDGASVVFPDGHIITQSGWDQDEKRNKQERASFHQARIHTGALDNRFVLDQLERLNSGDLKAADGLLRGRLDMTRVGALGHSFGGKVSIASIPEDSRVRFAMNLGGGLDPGSTYGSLKRPVAAMFGDDRKPRGPKESEAAYTKRKASRERTLTAMTGEYADVTNGSYFLLMDSPGFSHFSYYDFPDDQAQDPRWRATPEQWQHNQRLILDSVLAMFNAQLDWGERRPLAELPKRFPEIAMERIGGTLQPTKRMGKSSDNGQLAADFPRTLLGSWTEDGGDRSIIRFQPRKCTFAQVGRQAMQIVRAVYEPEKIVIFVWGRKEEYRFQVADHVLTLTGADGKMRTYRKLDNDPPEVQVRPLVLGEAKDLAKEQVQSIQAELARRKKIDQEVRINPAKSKDMQNVDTENTSYLVKLVQDVGWIDAGRFGGRASNDAFLLVQHSAHLPLMLAALPLIEKDVRAKRLDAQPYALLFDRLHVMLGEKQRYGSQIGVNNKGELVVVALEDRARVEELRKSIGLFSLAKYLKHFEKQNGGKPVRFQDDE